MDDEIFSSSTSAGSACILGTDVYADYFNDGRGWDYAQSFLIGSDVVLRFSRSENVCGDDCYVFESPMGGTVAIVTSVFN